MQEIQTQEGFHWGGGSGKVSREIQPLKKYESGFYVSKSFCVLAFESLYSFSLKKSVFCSRNI